MVVRKEANMSSDFRAETPEAQFTKHLRAASFHYADDTCREWDEAHKRVQQAAVLAVEQGWDDADIRALYKSEVHLVTYDEVRRTVALLRKGVK